MLIVIVTWYVREMVRGAGREEDEGDHRVLEGDARPQGLDIIGERSELIVTVVNTM